MNNLDQDILDAISHAIEDAEDQDYEVENPFWMSQPEVAAYVFLMAAAEIELDFPDFDLKSLPRGLWIGLTIFRFEKDCMNEGWGAVLNLSEDEAADIAKAYAEVDCKDEANGIERAFVKAREPGASLEAIDAAYRSASSSWKNEEDRQDHVCRYLKAHPGLFSE